MRAVSTLAFLAACGIEYQPEPLTTTLFEPTQPFLHVPSVTDRTEQAEQPRVDVLWVIDNSCSMAEEQAAVVENFPLFINYFVESNLDWHVGVVSTDMMDPNHRGTLRSANGVNYIDSSTPDPIGTFVQMAQMGINGSGTEQGLDTAYTALELKRNTVNYGFRRDDADLSLITISDEDDQSTEISINEFIGWLNNLKTTDVQVSYSSVVSPSPTCATAYEPGSRYTQVTKDVGGLLWSVCRNDWALLLDELGLLATEQRRIFPLSHQPTVSTIEVEVVLENGNVHSFAYWDEMGSKPKDFGDDRLFTYMPAANSVVFLTYVPAENSEVFITYDIAEAESYGAGSTHDTGN
jgi:hypothetical protein